MKFSFFECSIMMALEYDAPRWEQAGRQNREQLWVDLMGRHPAAEASAVVQALLGQAWLTEARTSNDPETSENMAWELHTWLVLAVNQNHPACAHALLDEGAPVNLVLPDYSYGGGQALREAIDGPPYRTQSLEPTLVERLWRETDMTLMLRVLQVRLTQAQDMGSFKDRYRHHLRQVVERTCHRPDLAPLLAEMYTQFGAAAMPAYAAMLQAQARQADLGERPVHPGPSLTRRRT